MMVPSKGSVQRLLCLFAGVFSCRAFIPPSCSRHVVLTSRRRLFLPERITPVGQRRVFMVMTENAGAGISDSSHDNNNNNNNKIHDLNLELDRLAERCSNHSEAVVACAAECEDLYKQAIASSELEPDIVSFNTVLKAWSNACATMVEHQQGFEKAHVASVPVYRGRDAAERATQLLMDMEKKVDCEEKTDEFVIVPDRTSYNACIDAWAKSRVSDAPQAAERLLKLLINHNRLEPDTLSYNGVLSAWAFSKSPNAMDKIDKIYNHMQTLHDEGSTTVKPTIRTVNSIVNAHAKRVSDYYKINDPPGALEHAMAAHALLKEMKEKYEETGDEEYQPDVTTYTTVMDAYGRCGQLEATLEAEELLKELHTVAAANTDNARLQPNYRTYTSLITAWSKTRHPNSPMRGEELLAEMQDLYEKRLATGIPINDEEETTKPNTRSYTGVIQCWGRSRDNSKAQRALRILQKMRKEYKEGNQDARPNLITYNAAIDACARCQGDSVQQTEALKIAFAMLKSLEIDPDLAPNHVTYSTLLKAAAFLMPAGPERNSIAKAVFDKAVKGSQVDKNGLRNLRMAVDNQVIHELLKDLKDTRGKIDYELIPSAWSKNIV